MGSQNIKWLYKQLPLLISKNIISEESSKKIREHYGEPEEVNWLKITLTIFGVLGAILIGSGIILIFGYNWNELSILVKTFLSFAPLIIAHIISGFALLKRKSSIVWKESSSIFLTITIGATISLIAQTFNISGDFPRFILTWALLTIPLVYIFDAIMPAIFYQIGMIVWAISVQAEGSYATFYWLLLALLVPFLLLKFKKPDIPYQVILLKWSICINLCISIGVVLEKVLPGLWIIIYSCLFISLIFIIFLKS